MLASTSRLILCFFSISYGYSDMRAVKTPKPTGVS